MSTWHRATIKFQYSPKFDLNHRSITSVTTQVYALVGVGLVLLLTTPNAQANDSHCYSIKNSDQKNYCLALAKHQDSYCYSIQESDSKNLCLAQIKNQKSYCHSIKASDSKNQCLAMVK